VPFIACHRETQARIDITQYRRPRSELKPGDCQCPLCNGRLSIREPTNRRAHFYHLSGPCTTSLQLHPESEEHLEGKRYLKEHLAKIFHEYTAARLEYEVPIREIRRVADLLVVFPNGWRIAHEVQLAAITPQELEERTDDYAQAGIDVYWWLGGRADTAANHNWCFERFGFSLTIDIAADIQRHPLLPAPRHTDSPERP
jgi:competence CoiA-like predicted nuclease